MTAGDSPLSGKRVLVTRAGDQAGLLIALLEARGAEVVHVPMIRFLPPPSWDTLDEVLDHPDKWNWLVFTSTNGVAFFFDRMNARQVDISSFTSAKFASVGSATASALRSAGIEPDVVPDRFRSADLLQVLPDNQQDVSTVIVRALEGRDELIDALREKGGSVHLAVAYETKGIDALPDEMKESLVAGEYDALTFTSPSTVENLFRHLTEAEFEAVASSSLFVSIGPTTSETIRSLGASRLIEASTSTLEGICQAVIGGLHDH